MSEHPPTLLIVYLCPAQNEDVLSHLDEALTVAGIEYRLIAQQEERVSLEMLLRSSSRTWKSVWFSRCVRHLIHRPLKIWHVW
jgi:hypothetical protein